MKIFLSLLVIFSSLSLRAQEKGVIYYYNVDSVEAEKKRLYAGGFPGKVEFAPIRIDLAYFPDVQCVLGDLRDYLLRWYPVDEVHFLDDEAFARFDKRDMIVQDLEYLQYKTKDYKSDGLKYHETFHIFSKLYFTAMVVEYADRYMLYVKVAEKVKNKRDR